MKMVALDTEDLLVLSTVLEGALFTMPDMTYQAREQRFVAVMKRPDDESRQPAIEAGIHFARVTKVQSLNMPDRSSSTPLKLIGLMFSPTLDPSGEIILAFEDERALRLSVECLEVALSDLSAKK